MSKTLTILVAEDDKFLATAITDKLSREGFVVVRAANGEEAISFAEHTVPDLVLLDVIMPKKTGFEVLAALKSNEATKSIPVIILSNLGQESDVEKAKSLGAVDYLIKSDVQMGEIVARVKAALPL